MFEGDSADMRLVQAKCKHIPDELWRWQANIVTTIFVNIYIYPLLYTEYSGSL
jgi:hypothetical protein